MTTNVTKIIAGRNAFTGIVETFAEAITLCQDIEVIGANETIAVISDDHAVISAAEEMELETHDITSTAEGASFFYFKSAEL